MISKILSLIILLFLLTLPFSNAQARSGCCSHHGGVCGCRCCDGTSLSATCAPYYPQCSAPKPIQTQPTTPQPITPNTENQQTNKNSVNSSNLLAEVPKENSDSGSDWLWIIGIGAVGYIFYRFIKRKKNINP